MGVTAVIYTATDVAGNTATCSFNVSVVGDAPTFDTCPTDIVMEATDAGNATVHWAAPTAKVSCNSIQITSTHSPGSVFAVGQTKVEYTAATANGLFTTCSFNISIKIPDIIANEVITPDGDSENDVWLIENIEKFPDNHVVVFDRWGSVVFQVDAYNNENVSWDGHNVPTGTYYYTLMINAWGSKVEKKGFIELVK
jgi:gliding motility-associated-like protein